MSVFAAKMIEIARRDVGSNEVTPNRAPWLGKIWPATTYGDGQKDRAPYCAAGMAFVLKQAAVELAAEGRLRETTGMSLMEFEKWRCKEAAVINWRSWAAKKKGVLVLPDDATTIAQPGDFMVFDTSHIGLVVKPRDAAGKTLDTVEYNTGPSKPGAVNRDGDGCWDKVRARSLARQFIRLPFK
jgi:hypothetical protein